MKFKAKALGRCVCGRQIYASVEQFAVLHHQPACRLFLDLEPVEFLAYVRRSRGIPDPPDYPLEATAGVSR